MRIRHERRSIVHKVTQSFRLHRLDASRESGSSKEIGWVYAQGPFIKR